MAVPLASNDRVDAAALRRAGLECPWQGQRELAALGGIGITVTFDPGQTIVIEGDPIRHYFRIVGGTVRLYKAIADGRRQVLDFLGEGQCFGLTGLERYTYSAEALSPVTLIRYSRQVVEAAIETNPELTRALFQMACKELDQAQRQMLLLGRKSADEKVASFLLSLRRRNGAAYDPDAAPQDSIIHLPMSRQDMADYLGLTIETVSRTMSRFKRLGLIGLIGRQHVALRQVERLTALAEGSMADSAPVKTHNGAHFGRHAGHAEVQAAL